MAESVVPIVQTDCVSTADDRRKAERHLSDRLCYVKPNGKNAGVAWGVRLGDISQEGVSLVLRVELEPETIVALQPARNSHVVKTLYARVVWHKPHENGWLHGCAFLRPLDKENLQSWLAD